MDLFKEKHTPQTERGPSQKAPGTGLSVFVGVGNFVWEEYSRFYGEEVGISRNWATFYCLTVVVNLGCVRAPVVA